MNRKKIIVLISAVFITVSIGMVGCSENKVEVNKNLTISRENVSNKSTLKTEKVEEILLESQLLNNEYSFKFNENNELLVEQIDINTDESLALYGLVNIEESKATLEYLSSTRYENISNLKVQFYVESISDDKVKISNDIKDEGYEIDADIIANENSKYSLDNNMLFEYVLNDEGMITSMIWRNLDSNKEGTINMPEGYKTLSGANLLGNKILITATSDTENIALPNYFLIVDIDKNEIEEEILIGTFGAAKPIDGERVVLLAGYGNDSALEIYNIKTKERNELFKYTYSDSEEEAINISYVDLFPSKDKIYYCEYTSESAYIKVAKIKDMGIENPVNLVELNIGNEYITEPPKVSIGQDEKDMVIYYKNSMLNGIERFYKIKLNS